VPIKGRVIEQTAEGADEHLKRLAKKYLGIGRYFYRKLDRGRMILKIKPEKIMGLNSSCVLFSCILSMEQIKYFVSFLSRHSRSIIMNKISLYATSPFYPTLIL
jgi:hypothetical protein